MLWRAPNVKLAVDVGLDVDLDGDDDHNGGGNSVLKCPTTWTTLLPLLPLLLLTLRRLLHRRPRARPRTI